MIAELNNKLNAYSGAKLPHISDDVFVIFWTFIINCINSPENKVNEVASCSCIIR